MELLVDENRLEQYGLDSYTGIFVRAKYPGDLWKPADIILLTKESLLEWLRSRGGENSWAENCVGIMLGHGNII
jgi:hypothetical protein